MKCKRCGCRMTTNTLKDMDGGRTWVCTEPTCHHIERVK
jgi:hypothetical protein